MDKNSLRFLMILAYCIPYGYLAMKGDAASGTMVFYGLMIISFGILCRIAIKTNNILVLIMGNILSFISSYLLTLRNLPSKEWSWYFKLFTPVGLLLLITIIFFVIQILIIFNSNKTKKSKNKQNNYKK